MFDYVEADFMEIYGIADVLGLPARRFMLLLGHLPARSRLVQAHIARTEETDTSWYKDALDKAMGRSPVTRRRVSAEAFIAGLR